MFSRQKPQVDVKKSTLKILDRKKDTPTKLKHLRLIVDCVDGAEAKSLFCSHYEPIYKIVYEGIVLAEGNLKQRGGFLASASSWSQSLTETLPFSFVHRAQREELESVLYLLEKILILCPDNLNMRWQLHSLSRLMAKLNHPGNSTRLRRDGIRLFLIWYQCLGRNAPAYVHKTFVSLVPGFGEPAWPPPVEEPALGVSPVEIFPMIPASPGEKQPEDPTAYFLECVLDFMVSQAPKIHWNGGPEMWAKSIDFLYERFKEFYLPKIFPNFEVVTNIYKPVLELPEPRKSSDMSSNLMYTCQVVFVKWIANYAHSVYRSTDCYHPTNAWTHRSSFAQQEESKLNSGTSPHSSLSADRESLTSYCSIPCDVDPNVLAKDVFLGTRENINFLHEVFRRALLLPFVHSAAIRRVICVYKDWIQINVPELPVFMLEEAVPEDGDTVDDAVGPREAPKCRLRTDSYYGAIGFNANNNREEYLSHLRAGAQKVLRVFFCNSAAVFLLFHMPKHETAVPLLEEQVDICKRVLNIYRYAVMNTRMDPQTWEQLLVVMLHVTSTVLDVGQSQGGTKQQDALGHKLASAMFQTLIVSWVKASLNVPISVELWDQLQSVLSQLTMFDDLITEWAKTMETLTRVLARHVYNLDLANLPLDRLTEQKAKRKRGIESGTSKEPSKQVSGIPEGTTFVRKRNISQGTADRKSAIFSPTSPNTPPQRKVLLRRSMSEGNITSRKEIKGGNDMVDSSKIRRTRKLSKSVDSFKRLISKGGLLISNVTTMPAHQPEWAEISSSTASLENASSNIHPDGDSIDGTQSTKEELRGVIAGGRIKGWLPSVAAILWKRMLGVLGNVNEFTNPRTHAHFLQIITEMWATLLKIRQNQDVSLDNLSSPPPSELVPPLLLPASWCFQTFDLPNEFHRGKVLACALLCEITLSNQDIEFHRDFLCKFYSTIHKCIIANNQYIVNEIVKRCGLRFISKMLPGFSLMLLDLVQAAHSVLSCDDLRNAPRIEASTLLGTILGVSDVCIDIKVLQPNSIQFQPVQAQYTKLVLSYLIQTAKVEQTSYARVIALQALTIYLCKQMMEIRHSGFPPQQLKIPVQEYVDRISEIFSVLLMSITMLNRSVVLVASDLLLMLADFAAEVTAYFPKITSKIIMVLKWSLQRALPLKNSIWTSGRPKEPEKRFFISLLMTLGEWCMRTPLNILLDPAANDSHELLSEVFDVLQVVAKGYQLPGAKSPVPISLEDFDPNVPFDDLQSTENRTKGTSTAQSDTAEILQDFQTVKLAARSLMSHLLTQLGHFPISSDAARCSSLVAENDDLGVEESELNLHIFSMPNLQMFAIDSDILLTLIELPNQDYREDEDGLASGFKTSTSQVRIILRDLSGKACWDASSLLSELNDVNLTRMFADGNDNPRPVPNYNTEENFFHSTVTGSFFPQMGPRLTVRHRHVGHLPTVENSAEDLDNLDDLLEYIGHTSPECLLRPGEPLTTPWAPPACLSQEQEDEVIASVVSQRSAELEYLAKMDLDLTMRAKPLHYTTELSQDGSESEENMLSLGASTKSSTHPSSFLLSRRFFSQLGLSGWEKRHSVYLLNKDEKLLRELKHLDNEKCRESHKIAVIYVAHGQEDKQSILYNTAGSEAYEDFVSGLGWEVELETHTGFMGGLHKNKTSGETAPYYATSFTEVIFHVATRLPSNTEESLLQKTRHLGNDEVHIVWSEHKRDYRRDIIPTEFCDVLIVVYPLQFGLYRVQISKKPEVPYFGPLWNEAVVNGEVLAPLVRATAMNASRARRSSLPYFQHHFQERAKTLSTIIQNHKIRTTFEQFAANVFSPLLPTASFLPGTRASASSFSTVRASNSSSTHLASALIDHTLSSSQSSGYTTGVPRRMTTGPSFLSSSSQSSSPYENINLSPNLVRVNQQSQFSNDFFSTSAPVSPIPPVPPKRLALKLGSSIKPKLHTPPDSPATSMRSTPTSLK